MLASKKPFLYELTFQKWDSSEDWTRIARISMRIFEKTRFARIWPSASKTGIFANRLARIDSSESAKRWCANRLPTKVFMIPQHMLFKTSLTLIFRGCLKVISVRRPVLGSSRAPCYQRDLCQCLRIVW